MFSLRSFRLRIVLWSVALEAILLLGVAVALVLILRTSQQNRIDELLRVAGSQLNATVDVAAGRFVIPSDDAAALLSEGISAWILAPDGQVAAAIGIADNLPLPASLPALQQMSVTNLTEDNPVRLYHTALQEGDAVLGSMVLSLSLRESEILQQRFMFSLLLLIPAILGLSIVGGLFLAQRALAPVVEITETAQRISAEDLSKRLNMDLPDDEIGRLASTFDAMLARLDDAFRREQQLTADVSHELRTPLSLLKAQLSLARTKPRDAETLVSMMAAMEGDVDRLTQIVEQTLLLSQVEQQGIAAPEPLFLDAVLLAAMERLQPIAQAKGVECRLVLAPQIDWQMRGDAQLLEQAFANLLQNAVAYTPTGGVVTTSAQRLWQGFTVSVADSGPGIAAEHLAHLFERYYRVDSARTRDTGGFGLGLTITDSIVRAHGGAIAVESVLGAGTTFTVTLPAAAH